MFKRALIIGAASAATAVLALAACGGSGSSSSADLQVTCAQGFNNAVVMYTATNTGSQPVKISSFSTTFYLASGAQEFGTMRIDVATATIAPGTSHTWQVGSPGGDFGTCKAAA